MWTCQIISPVIYQMRLLSIECIQDSFLNWILARLKCSAIVTTVLLYYLLQISVNGL